MRPNSVGSGFQATRRRCRGGVACLLVVGLAVGARSLAAQPSRESRWWLDEPIRFLQTNLSETDSTVDPKALVAAVAEFPANTFLINMGGIVAQYPTKVPFHYASAFLPPGRDLFGEVLREAHARRIRVVGRFDLSKTQKPVFDAHPEWFFKRSNGEPAIYNGLYSTCINGGLLPSARDDDPGGSARSLRSRRVVLQHVWQSVGRLQRPSDGAVPVRCLPGALPRPIRSARPGGGGCRLSRVHGRFIARGCRRDCRTDPSQAPERGVSDLHQGSHRRHHVGVEYGGRPGAAAVAVLGE